METTTALWILCTCVLWVGMVALTPRLLNALEARRHRQALQALPHCLPIIMPVSGRPEYLSQVLAGLRRVADITRTIIVFTQDERDPDVAALIAACGLPHMHLRHTQPLFGLLARLGLTTRTHCIGANIYFGIDTVLRAAAVPGVIVLEDDLVPGINFYRHFQWCFEHVLLHPERGARVLSCGAYNRYAKGDIPAFEHDALFCDKAYFSPWAWALPRHHWPDVARLWSFASWDSAMESRVMPCLNLVNYRSVHSHVQCIGHHGINGARAATCTYYTTDPVDIPLDYPHMTPRFYDEGLPDVYWHPYRDDHQQPDPHFRSEWDRKLLPRLWQHVQDAWPIDKRAAVKRWLPFF